MICAPCAAAADGKASAYATFCAACKRHIAVYTTASQKIVQHKVRGQGRPRVKCPGSGKHALITGHDACTGCDCQHHPVKEKSR